MPLHISKNTLNLVLLLAASFSPHLTEASVSQCKINNGALHKDNPTLGEASDNMWKKFDETCDQEDRCTLKVGDETAVTRLDYGGMRGTDEYNAVKKACKALGTDEFPTSLCHVNSELEVVGKTETQSVQFFAKKEPVCFAYQCGGNQVELVEKSPLGCNPETHGCVIHAEEATCKDRPEGAGSGNCKKFQEVINDDKTYLDAKDKLNVATGSHCQIGSQGDGVCKNEIKPIQITVGENFRTFESDETFLEYTDACYDAGGHTCYMSLNSRIVGQVVIFNLDVTGDYNDFPVCFPADCNHQDKETYAKELLAANMANKISGSLKNFVVRRRLSEEDEFDANDDQIQEHIRRVLQTDSNTEACPLGMKECEAQVVDFFCTDRDGKHVETVTLTPAQLASSSASTGVAVGSFVAAIAMAGDMLL